MKSTRRTVRRLLVFGIFTLMLFLGAEVHTKTVRVQDVPKYTDGQEKDVKLEYMVVEKPYVETPDTQKIVVSFGDANVDLTNVKLTWYNKTNKESGEVTAVSISKDGVVFEIPCKSEQDTGNYEIQNITYEYQGITKKIRLKEVGMDVHYGVNREVQTQPDAVAVESNEIFDMTMQSMRVASSGNVVVVLDPGHDATHGGTSGGGLYEADVNLKIARACKEELERYQGVTVYMTREGESCPYPGTSSADDNANRVAFAASVSADVYVSIHCNSATSSTAQGCEVYYPNSSYNPIVGELGANLASQVQSQLVSLGLVDRGIKIRNSGDSTTYPDGSIADYYGVIRRSKLAGIPAIIIEHGFQTNLYDVANFLGNDEGCRRLGVADATAIARYFNLSQGSPTVYGGVDYKGVFDPDYYYRHNADVAAAYGNNPNALIRHFVEFGMKEGRQASSVFDVQYYKSTYADLRAAFGNDLPFYYKHFLDSGMQEGRQASRIFNVYSYKNQYADLRAAFGNYLPSYYLHYIEFGEKEGRVATGCTALQGATTIYNGINYASVYDYNYYIQKNPDVNKVYGGDDNAVLEHFVLMGMKEGRQAKTTFDVHSYKNQYVDLRTAFGNDLKSYYIHYMNMGYKEGRKTTGCTTLQGAVTIYNGINYASVYDYGYYLQKNPDVNGVYGGDDIAVLEHFVLMGMKEGRQAKATFDVHSYKNQYVDLRTAFGNDLKSYYIHYMNMGYKEGRKTTGCTTLQGAITIYNGINYASVYDYGYYLQKNPDVNRVYGGDDIAVLEHFVLMGMKEGRQAKSTFNVQAYRKHYADLNNAFGDDWSSYYRHYLEFGIREGRTGV